MADEKKYRYFSTTTLKAFVSDIKAKVAAMIPTNVYDATEQRTANTVLAAPNGSNGAATFRKLVKTDLPAGLPVKSSTSVTVATSAWSNKAATVTVSGVTANNDIIVSYKPESKSVFETAGIYASAQAANSITFTCATVPTASVTINVLILT